MLGSGSSASAQIDETLKGLLGKTVSLDQKLIASSKKILLQRIEFEPAKKTSHSLLQTLRKKYKPLNASSDTFVTDSNAFPTVGEKNDKEKDSQVIVGISPSGNVMQNLVLDWTKVRRIGAGLQNLGNTCFLNAVLQCLAYTPPLFNYLTTQHHSSTCKAVGLCMICELSRHVRKCFDGHEASIKPLSILQKLRLIAKHMRWGRQEDAHEFLRYVVDAMQRADLVGISKPDHTVRARTMANVIFGGYLQSQVMCLQCQHKSITYDPFLDISLDVRNAGDVQKAFEKFVAPELLSNENAYICSRCCRKVTAKKSFSVHEPPNILTIQFKRYSLQGGKITRHIGFSELLDIRPYMSRRTGEPVRYTLYAVLLHDGHSTSSGHYYCYVRAPNNVWYRMNDSHVHQTRLEHVLQSQAYLLFYRKLQAPVRETTASVKVQAAQTKILQLSPALPNSSTTGSTSAIYGSSVKSGIILTNGNIHQSIASNAATNGSFPTKPANQKTAFSPSVILCESNKVVKQIASPLLQPSRPSNFAPKSPNGFEHFESDKSSNQKSVPVHCTKSSLDKLGSREPHSTEKFNGSISLPLPNICKVSGDAWSSSTKVHLSPNKLSPSKLHNGKLLNQDNFIRTNGLSDSINLDSERKKQQCGSPSPSKTISSDSSSHSEAVTDQINEKLSSSKIALKQSQKFIGSRKRSLEVPSSTAKTKKLKLDKCVASTSLWKIENLDTSSASVNGENLSSTTIWIVEPLNSTSRGSDSFQKNGTYMGCSGDDQLLIKNKKEKTQAAGAIPAFNGDKVELCNGEHSSNGEKLSKKKKKKKKKQRNVNQEDSMSSGGSCELLNETCELTGNVIKRSFNKNSTNGQPNDVLMKSDLINGTYSFCGSDDMDLSIKKKGDLVSPDISSTRDLSLRIDTTHCCDGMLVKKKKKKKQGDINHKESINNGGSCALFNGNCSIDTEVQRSIKKKSLNSQPTVILSKSDLLNGVHSSCSSNDTDSSIPIKKKGGKVPVNVCSNSNLSNGQISTTDSDPGELLVEKKKKHKKHHDGSVESDFITSTDSDSAFVRHKRAICNGTNLQMSQSSLDSSRTTNTCYDLQEQRKQQTAKKFEVQKWDDILPKGYHNVKTGNQVEKVKVKATWDGTADRSSANIVKDLEKLSHGYGMQVETWSGERTVLDQEMAKQRRLNAKRQQIDSLYDDGLDRGRTKKVRKKYTPDDNSLVDTDDFNPFQRLQNRTNNSR